MLVELGNDTHTGDGSPDGKPIVTYMRIPESYTFKRDVDTEDWRKELSHSVLRRGGIVNYEDSEVLSQLTHPGGNITQHMTGDPTWVWSDDKDAARFLSEYYQAPISAKDENDLSQGHNEMVDETHWRKGHGRQLLAPGVPASAVIEMNALLTNVGATTLADVYGGGINGGVTGSYAKTGVGSGATATTLTGASSLGAGQWVGAVIFVADTANSQMTWGNVKSNTTTAFTVDQWYTPAGALYTAGSGFPGGGYEYFVAYTIQPAWFMGISTDSTYQSSSPPTFTDISLRSEATAHGMQRKVSTYAVSSAVSAGTIIWTNSATYTYDGALGNQTFWALGLFNSAVIGDAIETMIFETAFSGSFTVSSNNDQATVTDTITGS